MLMLLASDGTLSAFYFIKALSSAQNVLAVFFSQRQR